MKRFLFILMIGVLSNSFLMAKESLQFEIFFNEEDFKINTEDGITHISTEADSFFMLPDGAEIPMQKVNIAVPSNMECRSINISEKNITLRIENTKIPATAKAMPTSYLNSGILDSEPVDIFDSKHNQIEYLGSTPYEEVTILHYAISPFEYDASSLNLLFNAHLQIDLELYESPSFQDASPISPLAQEIWADKVINPLDLNDYISSTKIETLDFILNPGSDLFIQGEKPYYVIITSDKLTSSFAPLKEWKRTKGINAEIITLESIQSNYSGKTIQEKIKNCLYSLYQNKKLQYVLLGGDESVIPSPKCSLWDLEIGPTDLYYACFNQQFDWDKNGNGILGEIADNCCRIPDIILTRLLVSNSSETSNIIDKILNYEKSCSLTPYLCMVGKQIDSGPSNSNYCDSFEWARDMYKNYIRPNWKGDYEYFFDEVGNICVDRESLTGVFNDGLSFVSIYSHGTEDAWSTKEKEYYYGSYVSDITRTNNPGTIITTIACKTNAFDMEYDKSSYYYGKHCLSKDFIVNKNTGVIGYFGASRNGYYNTSGGLSPEIERQYYTELFDPTDNAKNFGRIAAKAKTPFANITYSKYRGLVHVINPIGDPEMPIFIEKPKNFSNIKLEKNTNNTYKIITNQEDAVVCVTGKKNGIDYQWVAPNGLNPTLPSDMPDDITLCVTKTGYLPYVISHIILANANFNETGMYIPEVSILECGMESNSVLSIRTNEICNEDAYFTISDIWGNEKDRFEANDTCITQRNLLNLPTGVYVLNLIIANKPADSKRIIIK